jgi:hypothetical protein
MPQNPLQQYFRQPKIFISLPSQGVYNKLGTIQGDSTNLPVCAMTGMDEIILKTPDALLSGESSVKVIESCCTGIKDAWDLSILDTTLIFTAMRIATFGNTMSVENTCANCNTENEYDLDLSKIIEHFMKVKYNNKIVLKDLVINIRPLNYEESTDFSIMNFKLQQQLSQVDSITDDAERQTFINKLFKELAEVRTKIYILSVESVEIGTTVVTERSFIEEWMNNCEKSVFDAISEQIEKNREDWRIPAYKVQCSSCNHNVDLRIELDQSNFFAGA